MRKAKYLVTEPEYMTCPNPTEIVDEDTIVLIYSGLIMNIRLEMAEVQTIWEVQQ